MIIQWFGHSFFRLDTKNKVVAIDPYSEEATGLKPSRFKADILLVTHQHKDHNNKSIIMGDPFVLEGPGEVETGGIFIDGLSSFHDKKRGQARGKNTIFLLESEDITICHLGDLGDPQLKEETLAITLLIVSSGVEAPAVMPTRFRFLNQDFLISLFDPTQ